MSKHLLVLGCGYTGTATARLARDRGLEVTTFVRTAARAAPLRADAFLVHEAPVLGKCVRDWITPETHVVVAYPPDEATDAVVAPLLAAARAVTYVSSTGVYGDHRGVVDDSTPVRGGARQIAAEAIYREGCRAIVLRCPGIYGPDRGLHMRVVRGEHKIPGDGTRYLSRIHVADLAAMILASGDVTGPATFVVGDAEPAPHVAVVRFIAEQYGVAMPPSVPLESVHESLRGDRRVDPRRALDTFGVTLRYPTYREGMAPAATAMAPRR